MKDGLVMGALLIITMAYGIYVVREVWRKYVGHH